MAAGNNRFDLGDFFGGNMRVGDADREAVASQLRDHYADGRLTLDELNERLDQALAAKTRSDLAIVTRDLPLLGRPGAPVASRSPSGSHGQGAVPRAGGRGLLRAGIAGVVPALLAICGFLILSSSLAIGFGRGRPIGIIFVIVALALVRRLFGRRRGCGRYGRRW